jgi:putative hydrolase
MTNQSTFSGAVRAGRYWFHLHTDATDGALPISEYVARAAAAAVPALIFLEHIRRCPTYGTERFVRTVRQECIQDGITGLAGFEAKLLPDGNLDITDADLMRADVVGIAEHGWRGGPAELEDALLRCIERYTQAAPACPLVWVHPGASQPRFRPGQDLREAYIRLLQAVSGSGVWIERNLKYHLPESDACSSLPAGCIVTGIDCHTVEDLQRNP